MHAHTHTDTCTHFPFTEAARKESYRDKSLVNKEKILFQKIIFKEAEDKDSQLLFLRRLHGHSTEMTWALS